VVVVAAAEAVVEAVVEVLEPEYLVQYQLESHIR
jgi:hypothetical protein